MLFSSLEFLYLFLPLTLAVYFCAPRRLRNGVLLCASLIFYAVGEPVYVFLMALTVGVNFALGRLIARFGERRSAARVALWSAVVFDLGLLAFFKYYTLAASTLSGIFALRPLSIALPVGISFYTFQALSYVIDVYRGTALAQRSIVDFGTYITLFPQLIAGPIVRYTDIERELSDRRETVSMAASGIARFAIGLSKKLLLANPSGELWERLREEFISSPSTAGAYLALIFFAFQIYFDFSGYSDMAIGLGRIFGFKFPENFNYPYASRSVTEFWRRWHITLSSWFREYVYIPLGGSRHGALRTYLSLLAVWSLTGLWHGAAWNFLLWGIYFFVVLSLEKTFLLRLLGRAPAFFGHVWTLFCVLIGWLIFAHDGSGAGLMLSDGVRMLGALFGVGVDGFFSVGVPYELWRNLPFLAVMAIGSTALPKRIFSKIQKKHARVCAVLCPVLTVCALLLCTAYSVSSGYDPFLYFRF